LKKMSTTLRLKSTNSKYGGIYKSRPEINIDSYKTIKNTQQRKRENKPEFNKIRIK